jgi:Pyridoxamine 5'-phosphate oxidase
MESAMPENKPPATPNASRPDMPEYGLLAADQGQGLLPWHWAQSRLEKSQNYWVATTRPDGRPHAAAVWGVWMDDVYYFSTGRISRKARNLAANPSCVICTENAAEAVIVEGVAELVLDHPVLECIDEAYQVKYGSAFPSDSNVYAVYPKVVFGFIEAETEFPGSATRWNF